MKFWTIARIGVVTVGVALASIAPVRAQLPAPNPLVAPIAAPRAPAQLPAPVQPQGLPSLASVPSPPAAIATPAPRAFSCSCFGAATSTSWTGQVHAPGYFTARQAATGACLAYNKGRQVAPPVIGAHQGSSQSGPALTLPQGFENPDAGGSLASTMPGTLSFSTTAQQKGCSQCACD